MASLFHKYDYVSKKDYESVAGIDWPSYEVFVHHQHVPDFVYNEIDMMLQPQKKFDNPSFCVLPFYGWEYPYNSACCLLPKKHDLDQIKNDMLNGVRSSACEKCWNLEDSGHKSDRQVKNETLDFYLDRNINDLLEDCRQGKNKRLHYKIDTNNTCNAACVTCGSYFSSTWAQILKSNNQPYAATWTIKPDRADQLIDYNTAKLITFRGGEPLLSKTNFHVLEQLLQAGNTDCFISFQTNGSVTPNPEQEKLLKNFKNLNMSFSIDGIGHVFEYLRYPLQWNETKNNIDWFRSRNIDVSAFCSISNLSVYYHNGMISWLRQHDINYTLNPIYDPPWFSPGALPTHVKDQIDFDFTYSEQDLENYHVFIEKIAEQDHWKGIRMQDYLPELCKLLG